MKYPVTKDEILYFVNKLLTDHQNTRDIEVAYGDMRGILLLEIKNIVEKSDYKFNLRETFKIDPEQES